MFRHFCRVLNHFPYWRYLRVNIKIAVVDRSDVPSASLFDSLDAAVSKFCNEDSRKSLFLENAFFKFTNGYSIQYYSKFLSFSLKINISAHLAEDQKQVVKDTLIQLATGKIPYFTTNYFGGYDYTENVGFSFNKNCFKI